jgi:hypothetical protein
MALDLTLEQFREQFPEFAEASDSLVESRLDMAKLMCDPEVWGQKRSLGIAFLTAHYIAISPGGEEMRLQGNQKAGKAGEIPKTYYENEYQMLQRIVAGGAYIAAIQSELTAIRNLIGS